MSLLDFCEKKNNINASKKQLFHLISEFPQRNTDITTAVDCILKAHRLRFNSTNITPCNVTSGMFLRVFGTTSNPIKESLCHLSQIISLFEHFLLISYFKVNLIWCSSTS